MQLYRQTIIAYDQILHLDMYTGYGPRYQMSLVNSALEFGSSEEFEQKFSYPVVVAASPEEFTLIVVIWLNYYMNGCSKRFHKNACLPPFLSSLPWEMLKWAGSLP